MADALNVAANNKNWANSFAAKNLRSCYSGKLGAELH
jgi:hypothetical protein